MYHFTVKRNEIFNGNMHPTFMGGYRYIKSKNHDSCLGCVEVCARVRWVCVDHCNVKSVCQFANEFWQHVKSGNLSKAIEISSVIVVRCVCFFQCVPLLLFWCQCPVYQDLGTGYGPCIKICTVWINVLQTKCMYNALVLQQFSYTFLVFVCLVKFPRLQK